LLFQANRLLNHAKVYVPDHDGEMPPQGLMTVTGLQREKQLDGRSPSGDRHRKPLHMPERARTLSLGVKRQKIGRLSQDALSDKLMFPGVPGYHFLALLMWRATASFLGWLALFLPDQATSSSGSIKC
jgi:hypothetical protein